MFFKLDEKTLKDIIENQRVREESIKAKAAGAAAPKGEGAKMRAESKATESESEYDGHTLRFMTGVDGSTIVDADPPLIRIVDGDKAAPSEDVEVLTPVGWVKR